MMYFFKKIYFRASRLELCLNKYCIQQLLSILEIPPSTTPSSILALQETQRAFQAKNSIKKASGGSGGNSSDGNGNTPKANRRPSTTTTALSVIGASDLIRNDEYESTEAKSTLEIKFEAYAPTIIIPENSCCDIGYLLLDAGYLTIDGAMGPAGMKWNVKFNSINAAMPLKFDDIHGITKPLYLIRPFDIEVIAQDIDKIKADMTVQMKVSQISGELDPTKMSRLLYLTEVMSTIFETPTITFPTDNVLDTPDSRVVNPNKNQMNLTVFIPSITIDLQYGPDPLQKNILCVDLLNANVTTRVYDMQAILELRGLSVQDDMRFETQKYLASTPLSGKESLITIDIKKLSNKRSPFYLERDPFGTIINVKFGTLILNTDARNILHLRYFYFYFLYLFLLYFN